MKVNHKKEVAELLEDSLKEWEFEDRSVGIFSLPEQQIKVIRDIIEQLKKTPDEYDENFGDDKICRCGHAYYRHFDSYEDMYPCGCKYCGCREFEEMDEVSFLPEEFVFISNVNELTKGDKYFAKRFDDKYKLKFIDDADFRWTHSIFDMEGFIRNKEFTIIIEK